MLHGFSKSMFHRKFHRALLGLKIVFTSATSQKNHRHRNWLYNCRSDNLLICWRTRTNGPGGGLQRHGSPPHRRSAPRKLADLIMLTGGRSAFLIASNFVSLPVLDLSFAARRLDRRLS